MRILLADDQAIVRRGIRELLDEAGLAVAAEAEDGLGAIRICDELQPEVVILDLGMPKLNGIDFATRASKLKRPPAVVILSTKSDESYVMRALKAGVRAYILKSTAHVDLVPALHAVASGKRFFSPAVARVLIANYVRRIQTSISKDSYGLLTARETEVLQLVAKGRSNKDVAEELKIALETVRNHRKNLMKKLNLHNSREIVLYGARQSLVI